MEIGKIWAENYYVTKANLIHERVHNSDISYSSKDNRIYNGVTVYNDLPELNLFGVTDCIEISNNSTNSIKIIEYKPSKPKDRDFNREDLFQVFAQKLCVDYVFNCDSEAYIYYSDVRRRYKLPIKEEYNILLDQLKSILSEMRQYLSESKIPQIRKDQNCGGCSFKDVCIPLKRRKDNLRHRIMAAFEEGDI